MYSPKVAEELVPVLYRLAKDRKMPMTRLVNGIIREALTSSSLPVGKQATGQTADYTPQAGAQQAAA